MHTKSEGTRERQQSSTSIRRLVRRVQISSFWVLVNRHSLNVSDSIPHNRLPVSGGTTTTCRDSLYSHERFHQYLAIVTHLFSSIYKTFRTLIHMSTTPAAPLPHAPIFIPRVWRVLVNRLPDNRRDDQNLGILRRQGGLEASTYYTNNP